MLRTPATASSSAPMARLPPTQNGSMPAPNAPTIRFRNPKTSATSPSAPSRAGVPLMPRCPPSAPPHGLHGRLGEQQEAADHHGEVGEIRGGDEALQHLLEVRAG